MDFMKMFGKQKSKDVAKDRLKLILINDKGDLPKDVLEKMKNEILLVISKYVEFDSEDVEISLSRTDAEENSSPALIANIPIKHLR
ncbi:MAG: cell division topological specificity factor MinE [Clostridium sp.]|uniref:cell division topological specificity factor MinE n=1 Tax=Clostridium sp. TaxID=1506 RepID=UPI002A8B5032|nr:cell division topological specificity factor MinE [Clostridium sp.]MDY5097345.1 cell division topological specificity factor MinE [Clostridium sp.]